QSVLPSNLQQSRNLATPNIIIVEPWQVIGGVLEGTTQGLTPSPNFKHPSCFTGLVGWDVDSYPSLIIDSEPLAHQGIETMLIPNVTIHEFLSLMRVRIRRNVCFEAFEGVMQSPDVDTITTYHPKALANQRGFMLAIAIQDRGEGTLGSSSHETTHALWQDVQE